MNHAIIAIAIGIDQQIEQIPPTKVKTYRLTSLKPLA
jgi:hypothetical protein